MLVVLIRSRCLAAAQPVVDMAPIMRRDVRRIEAGAFDHVDGREHTLNARPARLAEQNLAAGAHARHGRACLGTGAGAEDIDGRHDRAEVICPPADERKDRAGREPDQTSTSIKNLFANIMTETQPLLDAMTDEDQHHAGQRVVLAHRRCLPPAGRRLLLKSPMNVAQTPARMHCNPRSPPLNATCFKRVRQRDVRAERAEQCRPFEAIRAPAVVCPQL